MPANTTARRRCSSSSIHLTNEVRPYVVSHFGTSANPSDWAVAGWSMGGTCAIDLAVMHPDLFATFEDIGGDRGPNSGTKQQTIERLYGGDAARGMHTTPARSWQNTAPTAASQGTSTIRKSHPTTRPRTCPTALSNVPHRWEKGALPDLCSAAMAVHIGCSLRVYPGYHTWQLAARAFSNALPWIAQRVNTPTAGT